MKHKFTLAMIIIVVCGFALVMLLPHTTTGCGEQYKKDVVVTNISRTIDVAAQLATTEFDRELGLSNKKCIGADQAMLFVFDEPGFYGIWMKNMMFPIDIVWVSESKEIISIEKNVSPESFPRIYTPKAKSKYVIELQSGLVDKSRLRTGDRLYWQ